MGRRLFRGTDLRSRALPGHCSVSATWVRSAKRAMPARREPVAGSRPNAALLFIIIFIVFHCYLRGRERRAERANPCDTRRNSPLGPTPALYFIVINNAAVRERRARHKKRTARRPPTKRARVAAPGKMLASILARFGAVLFTISNSPVRAPAARRLPCVRRAEPSAPGIVSGRPRRMRILAQLRYVVNSEVNT